MRVGKKLLAGLTLTALICSNLLSSGMTKTIKAEGINLPEPKLILAKSLSTTNVTPGDTIHMVIPVKCNQYISEPYISVDVKDAPMSVVSDITLSREGYSTAPTALVSGIATNVEFNLKVKDTAKAGQFSIYLKGSGINGQNEYKSDFTMDRPVLVRIGAEKSKPALTVTGLTVPTSVKAGSEFSVKFTLLNQGELAAKNISISVDGYAADGVMPRYSSSALTSGDLAQGQSQSVLIPMKAAPSAVTGYKPLTIKLTCKDVDGNAYPAECPVYVNVEGSGAADADPNILISHVTQSVSSPVAGKDVTVSFFLENRSKGDIKQIKITPTNLTNTTFSPKASNPYQYISALDSGAKQKVSIPLKISENAVEGHNDLDISYTYKDESGKTFGPVTAKLFVLNVTNPEDEGSTPKLIISEFKTSKQELKAGGTFDFRFNVFNTNSKVSAKNIKVTMTSTDNVFSVTKGSNSFYIPIIKAGDTKKNVVSLKVKSDCVTKAYPIEIKFEYEYEGMPKPADGTISPGVTISEIINLQVMENARPVVNNIVFGYGESPMVNTPTTLNFEFYNMGKSVLSNVTAKIDCPDMQTTSAMLFIGNVEAGSGDVQEMEVTPMVEGPVSGNLIITYEDSNGNTVEVPTPFETTVSPMPVVDPGTMDPGMGEVAQPKKALMPLPVFVVLEVILFAIAVPMGRKITLGLYKKKLRKAEDSAL